MVVVGVESPLGNPDILPWAGRGLPLTSPWGLSEAEALGEG